MILAALDITPNTTSWSGALLFTIGAVGLLLRRNVLVMFMCVELMLDAANLTFVTFAGARRHRRPGRSCSSPWWWRRPRSRSD